MKPRTVRRLLSFGLFLGLAAFVALSLLRLLAAFADLAPLLHPDSPPPAHHTP